MMRTKKQRDERAVSEAISYVLVFALIFVGGVLVILQGAPAIDSAQDGQIAENSKRAAHLLQDRVDEMVRQDAPSRQLSVNVQDIRVGVGELEPARVRVEATNTSGGTFRLADIDTDPVYIKTTPGNLEQTVAYENGAVLVGRRGVRESWTMSRRPSWAVTTNSATGEAQSVFLRTVSTTGSGSVGGGQSRARVSFETVSREDETVRNVDELEISVESPRSGAWKRYLGGLENGVEGGDISTSGDRVTLLLDEFEGGSGTVVHKKRIVQTEVRPR